MNFQSVHQTTSGLNYHGFQQKVGDRRTRNDRQVEEKARRQSDPVVPLYHDLQGTKKMSSYFQNQIETCQEVESSYQGSNEQISDSVGDDSKGFSDLGEGAYLPEFGNIFDAWSDSEEETATAAEADKPSESSLEQ